MSIVEIRPPTRARPGAHGLDRMFAPRSVALVGVSDSNNMSLCIHRNMLRHGFRGPAYYVNPNRDRVHGQPTVKSLSSIGEAVDLAFLVVSGNHLTDIVEEAATCDIRNLVILAGGYGEAGEEGENRQRDLISSIKKNRQRLVGPNTIGFLNLPASAVFYGSNLTPPAYPDRPVKAGSIGVVVQSGVIAHAMLRGMLVRHVGPSLIAAVGNEADVAVHDVIEYLIDDEATTVIALFLETIRDHRKFSAACARARAEGKPIVAMRAGRSARAARTALSHTGALVGDQKIFQAGLEKLGVIQVTSVDDLIVTSAFLANYGVPAGRRAAFIAISGGLCEIFADRAAEVGIELPDFSADTTNKLVELLPSSAAALNPLDTTGIAQTDTTIFPRAIRVVGQDDNFDALFVARNTWRSMTEHDDHLVETYRRWGDAIKACPRPVILVGDLLADATDYELGFRTRTDLPPEIGGLEHGLAAFAAAARWNEVRIRDEKEAATEQGVVAPLPVKLAARERRKSIWTEWEGLEFLERNGIPVVPRRLTTSADESVAAADTLGYPVVVKIASPDIAHKSSVGGVVLDVRDAAGVREAFAKTSAAARALGPHIRIDGVLIMPMRPASLELIVGITRDDAWGLALVIGMGGVWTEVLNDTVVTPLSARPHEIRRMVRSLRSAPLLDGGHGRRKIDLESLVTCIARICAVAEAHEEEIESMEINPLRLDGDVIEALDALIIWKSRQ